MYKSKFIYVNTQRKEKSYESKNSQLYLLHYGHGQSSDPKTNSIQIGYK